MKIFSFILLLSIILSYLNDYNEFKTPDHFPQPFYNFRSNELKKEKIKLGQSLFFDPILSENNSVSCENCHSPFSSFTHIDHALSHGIYDSIGKRNSPVLINLAWQNSFMWDGAVNHLDMQPLAPISNPKEMGSSINKVVEKLNSSYKYRKLFYLAFGDSTASGERTLKALSQFLLTLVSSGSKYDEVMLNKKEFTEQEKNGYLLFKKNCAVCHAEPLFTTGKFENIGLPVDPRLNDMGRMFISQNSDDSLKFKIPTLRNIEYSYPYMHDGRFKKLSEVLNHYSRGIQNSKTLSPHLKKGINLNSNEKVDLISFLLTLSDKNFVFNPAFQNPGQ